MAVGGRYGSGNGGWKAVVAETGTTRTILAAENNTLFTNGGAGGNVLFTLPTLAVGLRFGFMAEAAGTMSVTGAAVDLLVAFNDAAATTVAYSTTNEIIGGMIEVVANAAGTKWLCILHNGKETQTPVISA